VFQGAVGTFVADTLCCKSWATVSLGSLLNVPDYRLRDAEPVYPCREKGVLLAMRVKTVNMEPAGKTVGRGRDRYRLHGVRGIEVHTF
jgi:hypothetical protein